MKIFFLLIMIALVSGCGGGGRDKNEISQHELYGKKRVDCTQTKSTDEAANITQCSKIRPDEKKIENTDNLREDYSPDSYNTIY